MALIAEQILNGINYGLLLFLIAAGLSLVFGVMHLINLAHGSLFMVGAFATAALVQLTGSFVLSAVYATVLAAAVGYFLERTIIRKLYARSHLDQVLATFGLILFVNEFLRWLSGGVPQFVPAPELLSGTVTLPGNIEYPAYRLMVTAVAAVTALGLWAIIARTRAGMLVRASASNPAMVRHIGFDVGVVSTVVFASGAGLAGLAGVLTGPLVSIEVGMGEQVLILSFVIVVIGGLGSIRGTFLSAMLVGLVDTLGRALMPLMLGGLISARTAASLAPALSATLVYVLMAVVLIMRPRGLFAVGSSGRPMPFNVVQARLGTGSSLLRRFRSCAASSLLLTGLAVAPVLFDGHVVSSLTRGMIYGIAACAVGFAIRYGGMVSFGHAAYFGLGAYTVLAAQSSGIAEALIVWPLAVLVSAAAAFLIGFISLRTRGVSFIMITLGFAQMVYFLISGVQAFGGADGLGLAGRSTIGSLSRESTTGFHLVVFGLLLIVLGVLARVARSPFGLALEAIRQNERRVTALGYDTTRLQLTAFVLSAAATGLAGALAAEFYVYVTPGLLHWSISGELLVMATLGGLTALTGGLFGALALLLAEALLTEFTTYWRMILGPVVIVAVLYLREGLQPAVQKLLGGRRD